MHSMWLKGILELQEEILQMLLESLEEKGILENRVDDLNECFYLRNPQKVIQRKEKETEIIDSRENDTPGTPILEMLTPFRNKNISGDIKELEDFQYSCL